jgi:hypothetical protein
MISFSIICYCLYIYIYYSLLVLLGFKSRRPPASSLCCGRQRQQAFGYTIHGSNWSFYFSRQFISGFLPRCDVVIRQKVQTQADFVFAIPSAIRRFHRPTAKDSDDEDKLFLGEWKAREA